MTPGMPAGARSSIWTAWVAGLNQSSDVLDSQLV
jgi:hypothetical protein